MSKRQVSTEELRNLGLFPGLDQLIALAPDVVDTDEDKDDDDDDNQDAGEQTHRLLLGESKSVTPQATIAFEDHDKPKLPDDLSRLLDTAPSFCTRWHGYESIMLGWLEHIGCQQVSLVYGRGDTITERRIMPARNTSFVIVSCVLRDGSRWQCLLCSMARDAKGTAVVVIDPLGRTDESECAKVLVMVVRAVYGQDCKLYMPKLGLPILTTGAITRCEQSATWICFFMHLYKYTKSLVESVRIIQELTDAQASFVVMTYNCVIARSFATRNSSLELIVRNRFPFKRLPQHLSALQMARPQRRQTEYALRLIGKGPPPTQMPSAGLLQVVILFDLDRLLILNLPQDKTHTVSLRRLLTTHVPSAAAASLFANNLMPITHLGLDDKSLAFFKPDARSNTVAFIALSDPLAKQIILDINEHNKCVDGLMTRTRLPCHQLASRSVLDPQSIAQRRQMFALMPGSATPVRIQPTNTYADLVKMIMTLPSTTLSVTYEQQADPRQFLKVLQERKSKHPPIIAVDDVQKRKTWIQHVMGGDKANIVPWYPDLTFDLYVGIVPYSGLSDVVVLNGS